MESLPLGSQKRRQPEKTVLGELEVIRTELRGLREDIRGFRSMRTEVSNLRKVVEELIALVRQALPLADHGTPGQVESPGVTAVADESRTNISETPLGPNMKLVELLHSGLFKKHDGKQVEFGILHFGKFSRSDHILAENCAILIQLCGGKLALKLDVVVGHSASVRSGVICLLLQSMSRRTGSEVDLLKIRDQLDNEIYSPCYVWHSILTGRRVPLQDYRICATPLHRTYFRPNNIQLLGSRWENPKGIQTKSNQPPPPTGEMLTIHSLLYSSSIIVPTILNWNGHAALFLLICNEGIGSDIRRAMASLIQLAGGRVVEYVQIPRADECVIPIFLGYGVPRADLEEETSAVGRKLRCEIFSDELLPSLIFSRISIKAKLQDNSRTNGHDFSTLEAFRVKPCVSADTSALVEILRGEQTWKSLREKMQRLGWHAPACIQGIADCVGCMPKILCGKPDVDHETSSTSKAPDPSFGGLAAWAERATQFANVRLGKDDMWRYLDQVRSAMKGQPNHDIAEKFCKKFRGCLIEEVVKGLNDADANGCTVLELQRKRKMVADRKKKSRQRQKVVTSEEQGSDSNKAE